MSKKFKKFLHKIDEVPPPQSFDTSSRVVKVKSRCVVCEWLKHPVIRRIAVTVVVGSAVLTLMDHLMGYAEWQHALDKERQR